MMRPACSEFLSRYIWALMRGSASIGFYNFKPHGGIYAQNVLILKDKSIVDFFLPLMFFLWVLCGISLLFFIETILIVAGERGQYFLDGGKGFNVICLNLYRKGG